MDAVEFLKEYNRMCGQTACESCPLYSDGGCDVLISFSKSLDLRECVETVERWAKDNPAKPVKTRQSEFLKMFPNANRDKDGTLHACPEIFEPEIKIECDGDCHRCKFKRDYWLQEVE